MSLEVSLEEVSLEEESLEEESLEVPLEEESLEEESLEVPLEVPLEVSLEEESLEVPLEVPLEVFLEAGHVAVAGGCCWVLEFRRARVVARRAGAPDDAGHGGEGRVLGRLLLGALRP